MNFSQHRKDLLTILSTLLNTPNSYLQAIEVNRQFVNASRGKGGKKTGKQQFIKSVALQRIRTNPVEKHTEATAAARRLKQGLGGVQHLAAA